MTKLNWNRQPPPVYTGDIRDRPDDAVEIPDEILALKDTHKLNVPKRIQLKKFFKNSNKASQIAAIKIIFGFSDIKSKEISESIKLAFEQNDFIPWPNKFD